MSETYKTGWKELSLDCLQKADWNYKVEDDAVMAKLIENFKKNSQVENIIVRVMPNDKYEVVNGNHRLDAMLKLGLEKAFCFDVGIVSDAEAKRIAIETNETRFPVNPIRLSEVVASLTVESGVDDLLKTIPFSKDQIDGMNILSDVHGEPNGSTGKDKKETVYYIVCESCGEKHYTTANGEPLLPNNGGLATSGESE